MAKKVKKPATPQTAEITSRTRPPMKIVGRFKVVRPATPMIPMTDISRDCPTTHQPPRWTKRLLMLAGKNLHHRAAAGVPITFDDITLDFMCNQQFQSRKLVTESGQSHEQFR